MKSIKLNRPMKALLILITVLIVGEYLVVSGTYKASLSSQTCAKCHNMLPEVYTWQKSSHNKVECADCHVQPGTVNLIKYNAKMVGWLVETLSGNYMAPIRMTDVIPDSACNKCHSMDFRNVTPSGDLVIPHSVHKGEKVPCVKCHVGLAHGEIADRRVTFEADYARWSPELGTTMMHDYKYVRPSMDTCTNCHRVKKGPMGCAACHLSSMLPTDHRNSGFLEGGHGGMANNRLDYCDSCHGYMSQEKVTGVQKEKSYIQFLNQSQTLSQGQGKGQAGQPKTTPRDYAAQNTFCRECHSKAPSTHLNPGFMSGHGTLAKANQQRCLACHNNNGDSSGSVAGMACGTCHPSRHGDGWKKRHPIQLPAKASITAQCYQCHVANTCNNCHVSRQKPVDTQGAASAGQQTGAKAQTVANTEKGTQAQTGAQAQPIAQAQ